MVFGQARCEDCLFCVPSLSDPPFLLHSFPPSFHTSDAICNVFTYSIPFPLPPSLPPSFRRPGVLHLLERDLIKLDIHHSNTNKSNDEEEGEGGRERRGGSPVRPSASPVARLLFGYNVRGGLYFERNGERGREEAEGGEGLGGGREEAEIQALPFSSSLPSQPDGVRGRAEASGPLLLQSNAVVGWGGEGEERGFVPFHSEAQRGYGVGGQTVLPPQKKQGGEGQGLVEGVQPLLVNGHEASVA